MVRTSCVQHDVRINVDRSIEPRLQLFTELDLLLVDSNTIRFGRKALFVVLGVGLIPVLDGSPGSADAESLAEIAAFG